MNSPEQVFQQMIEIAEIRHTAQQEELAKIVREYTDKQFNDLLHYVNQKIIMGNILENHKCWDAGNTIKLAHSLVCLKNAIWEDCQNKDIRVKMRICNYIDRWHKSLTAFIDAHVKLFLIPYYGCSKKSFFLLLKIIEQKISTCSNEQNREEARSIKTTVENAIPHKWISEWQQINQPPNNS